MTIVVSSGVGKVIVPNVVGESRDQATSDLRAAGLSARVVKQTTSDPNADDQVINQAPVRGDEAPSRRGGHDQRRQVQGADHHDHDHHHDHQLHQHDALMRVAVLSGGRSSEHEVSLRLGSLGRRRAAGSRPRGESRC